MNTNNAKEADALQKMISGNIPQETKSADTEQKIITREEVRATAADVIWLAGCAVNQIRPEKARLERMNSESVHKMSRFHGVTALCCMAVEDGYGGVLPNTSVFATWLQEKNQAIYKTLRFDAERAEILAFLEKSGIWHMPLKGVWLKELYPKVGMREMADNDILYDSCYKKQVHEWFLSRGYGPDNIQKYQTAYHKKPFFNFEMHTSLFSERRFPEWTAYYSDIKERLLQQPGTNFGYRFTDEDFYIYLIVHAFKHVNYGGTGIRTLLDCYVYITAKNDLDWGYIHGEMEKLGIASAEEKLRSLSRRLFADPIAFCPEELSGEEQEFLDSFLLSGTYGTVSNQIRNKMKEMGMEECKMTRRTKARYLRKRIFPDQEFFKKNYPFFYRHRWLLPAGYLYRLFYRSIRRSKILLRELAGLRKM